MIKPMITLTPINDTQYKVVITTDELTFEERAKLIRKRDLFPAEFVQLLIELLPEHQTFDTYSHYDMILNVT